MLCLRLLPAGGDRALLRHAAYMYITHTQAPSSQQHTRQRTHEIHATHGRAQSHISAIWGSQRSAQPPAWPRHVPRHVPRPGVCVCKGVVRWGWWWCPERHGSVRGLCVHVAPRSRLTLRMLLRVLLRVLTTSLSPQGMLRRPPSRVRVRVRVRVSPRHATSSTLELTPTDAPRRACMREERLQTDAPRRACMREERLQTACSAAPRARLHRAGGHTRCV